MEDKIYFDSGSWLNSLYAGDQGLLKELSKHYEVDITSRDAWVKISGNDDNVRKAKEVFQHLDYAKRKGINIDSITFKFAINEVDKLYKNSANLETPKTSNKINATPENSDNVDNFFTPVIESKILKPRNYGAILPKSQNQIDYIKKIDQFSYVFGLGAAGSGKTYLAVAKAVEAFENRKVDKLIFSRPAVEAGEALGFLPGNLEEKIFPYLRPLYDSLYEIMGIKYAQDAIEKKFIEIAPLAYMRGRTLNKAFVILDEAQNATREQMLMFLTRIGEGSKAVITGDPSQIDLTPRKNSGLLEAISILPKVAEIAFVNFGKSDVVRHPIVAKIIKAYEDAKTKQE